MKNIKKQIFTLSILALTPLTVLAAPENLSEAIDIVLDLIEDYIIPLIIALAVVYFLWGVSKFVLYADNETERAKGKQVMIWGVLAIFVMVSLWAIIAIIAGTFDITLGVPALRE